jgi:branched-chain amino acid transport system substrate-binding protein
MQPAAYARDNKITKAGLMVIDVPGASGPAKALGVPMMQKAGVAAPDLVAIPTGAADMLPQAQAELKKNPELIHLIGNDVWCTAALRALRDAGYSGKITMISQCMSDATVKALGSFLKGVLVGYGGTADPNDPDFKLMTAIVNKYVSNPSHVKLASNPIGAYGVMNSFLRIFKDYKGDYTPAALTAYAKASPALPLPLGAGAMFHCDGKAVSILPAICTSGMVQATLDATGQPTDFKAVDPGTLLVFG